MSELKPITRVEQLLDALLNGKTSTVKPLSRVEVYLKALCEKFTGSGGGTSVQADLSQNDPEAADYVKGVIRKESLSGNVPWTTTASVGQTIAVKAVDDAGKPTEWETVAFPKGGVTAEDIAELDSPRLLPVMEYGFDEENPLCILKIYDDTDSGIYYSAISDPTLINKGVEYRLTIRKSDGTVNVAPDGTMDDFRGTFVDYDGSNGAMGEYLKFTHQFVTDGGVVVAWYSSTYQNMCYKGGYYINDSCTAELYVYGMIGERLDEMYIPDTIARITDIPKAAAVADVTATPTAEEFNTLLAALRNAGLMATELEP